MNTNITENKKSAFIDARISEVRLSTEHVASTPPVQPSQDTPPLQLNIEVTSGFTIGIDSPQHPKIIVIRIQYNLIIKNPENGHIFITYEASHEAQFTLIGSSGITDWTTVPQGTYNPYFSMMYDISRRRAEGVLLEAGFKGLLLPKQEQFDGDTISADIKTVSGG